jgi:hypothetical protein
MERLPLETQTLYAEFLERLVATQARRSIGQAPGCFTAKTVKGDVYIYFQYSDPGGRLRQAYVGKKSPALDKLVATFQEQKSEQEDESVKLQRLCAQLRAGGALTTDAASARVMKAFADCGLFHLGGVLVGTHAFTVLGNMLGVRWEQAFLRTQDIDIAGTARLDVAVPELKSDIPKVLENLQMGFLPVPPLNPKRPSTSFKVRGHPVRVDFLTPAGARGEETPVFISRFSVSAQPLRYLDYLLEQHQPAGVVDGGGILVNVPHPARYAFHKLLVGRSRDVTSHMKTQKDLEQASHLLSMLADERPGDLALAWEALSRRGRGWLQPAVAAIRIIEKRHRAIAAKLRQAVPALRAHLRA